MARRAPFLTPAVPMSSFFPFDLAVFPRILTTKDTKRTKGLENKPLDRMADHPAR